MLRNTQGLAQVGKAVAGFNEAAALMLRNTIEKSHINSRNYQLQ